MRGRRRDASRTDSDDETCTMLYFDERGVGRRHDITFHEDGFTWSRDTPQFAQRSRVTMAKDGRAMKGEGMMKKDGAEGDSTNLTTQDCCLDTFATTRTLTAQAMRDNESARRERDDVRLVSFRAAVASAPRTHGKEPRGPIRHRSNTLQSMSPGSFLIDRRRRR